MRTSLFLTFLICRMAFIFQAQKPIDDLWQDVEAKQLPTQAERLIIPYSYRVLQLDFKNMKSLLAQAPPRFGESFSKSDLIMPLPIPSGELLHFRVYDAPVLHPDLAARYPDIRSFVGQGIEDPTAVVRFDYTPQGFHAMLFSSEYGTVFIDPYAKGNTEYYISYFKRDFVKLDDNFTCHVDEIAENLKKSRSQASQKMAGDCQLRTYRLALACTGEYAQFHGGTVAGALAAMNTTMTRVNGVFERDAAITMQLVANNDQLIFLDPTTDPYSNNDGNAMLSQNQTTCDNIIGSANYDIGHVFSTGGGGVAFLESPCNNNNKAKGVTGSPSPVGDPFDIDYVAHEMGHQYGGRHTQNNNCNRDLTSSYEPGSASTIMGYAGICSPNIQPHSDDYYHINSIILMGNFVTGVGNTCPTTTTTGNTAPTANAGSDYTIPRGTPFVLEGSGSDPDGDALTYCWEQYDKEVASMPPQASNTAGPAFRSLGPMNTPKRYLPNLDAVVNGVSPTWEVLSDVSRNYHFRLTVRDNFAGAGCTDDDEMIVTVVDSGGPFLVTSPNTSVVWNVNDMQTITWDVANTDNAAINCTAVDILLSLDGGYTYPVTLASGVPNDGMEVVVVPNMPTNAARVQVKASNNIFYDISDQDFTIQTSVPDFAISVSPAQQVVCLGNDSSFEVQLDAVGNYTGDVTLTVNGLPASLTTNFSVNPVAVPGSSTLAIGNTNSVPPGTYAFEVVGSDGVITHIANAVLIVQQGTPDQVLLLSPMDGAVNVPLSPTLSWEEQQASVSYYLELSEDSMFTTLTISDTTTSASYAVGPLAPNTTYYWHVFAQNECGEGAFSPTFSFTTQDFLPPTECLPPTDAMATTTANTALVSWPAVPGALKYKIRYRVQGSMDDWKEKGTFTNQVALVGLSANTAYEYQLRTRCMNNMTDWSDLFSFVTQDGMDDVSCVAFAPIMPVSTTPTTALISWNAVPNAFLYRLRYRELGTDLWVRKTTQDTALLLQGLVSATTYEYQTKTLCAFGWTPWSDSVYQFTTDVMLLLNQEEGQGEDLFALPFGKYEQATTGLVLFPNPVTDKLMVRWPYGHAGETLLSIRNLSGKLLYSTLLTTDEMEINLLGWPAGIYLLEVRQEGQAPVIRRFVRAQ